MPTGYTACVEEGASFQEFLWGCARGMGALAMMRDEPHDAPIPEQFEPSDYHSNKIAETTAELTELKAMSAKECDAKALATFLEHNETYHTYIEKHKAIAEKYRQMIAETEAWMPPTPDHVGLKEFMLQQLNLCYKDEADTSFYESRLWAEPLAGETWRRKTETDLTESLAYHTKNYNEEVERTEGRNKWLKALRDSVPPIEALNKTED